MKYRKKKIWLNEKRTKYCWVRLYVDRNDMIEYYRSIPGADAPLENRNKEIRGVCIRYSKMKFPEKRLSKDCATILLNFKQCGAAAVTHEIFHAILWSRNHRYLKKENYTVIKTIQQEERLLENHSLATIQFYKWFWKVESWFKRRAK